MMRFERGDVLLIAFDPTKGSEIQKTRPAIVITNDIANRFSRVLVVVPLTSQNLEKIYPHEVLIEKMKGLTKDSKANVAQMRAVDRLRIKSRLGAISERKMKQLDIAIKLHLGLA